MGLFSIRIQSARRSGNGDPFEIADNDAWTELTRVCSDLVGEASRTLSQNSEWKMELLDEDQKPTSRIRLVAETLDSRVVQRR